MKYIGIIIAIAVIGIGAYILFGRSSELAAPSETSNVSASVPTDSGERLPALTLKDYEGNDMSLSDFSGKALIVNSWAAWCPFCRQELPDLAALQREFPDIGVIAIDRAESLATAKRYSDELDVTGKLVLLLDPRDSFYKAIGGFTMPETIFVNAAGAVVFHKRGPMSLSEMREKVLELKLAE